MAKIEIFTLAKGHFCTTLWVKQWVEITILYGFRDIHFYFLVKIQDGDEVAKIEIFSPLNNILFSYPVGQKCVPNHSISYTFRDIHTFSFSAKIQDDHQKW